MENLKDNIYKVVNRTVGHDEYKDFHDLSEWCTEDELAKTFQSYADQEVSKAIDKALELYSKTLLDSGLNNDFDVMSKRVDIKPEILKQLNPWKTPGQ